MINDADAEFIRKFLIENFFYKEDFNYFFFILSEGRIESMTNLTPSQTYHVLSQLTEQIKIKLAAETN